MIYQELCMISYLFNYVVIIFGYKLVEIPEIVILI